MEDDDAMYREASFWMMVDSVEHLAQAALLPPPPPPPRAPAALPPKVPPAKVPLPVVPPTVAPPTIAAAPSIPFPQPTAPPHLAAAAAVGEVRARNGLLVRMSVLPSASSPSARQATLEFRGGSLACVPPPPLPSSSAPSSAAVDGEEAAGLLENVAVWETKEVAAGKAAREVVRQRACRLAVDERAAASYVYPTDEAYPVRAYQHSMAYAAFFQNTLVCLPTGLGKTFVAGVVMYNFYRWFPHGRILFTAPTRPLVQQQIRACYGVMGIPQEEMCEMTGNVPQARRRDLWREKRLFFLTPQVAANDFATGVAPAADIACLVVDEAHRARGNYAYCDVVRQLESAGASFRVLALSATPGNDLKGIQEVVDNLMINHIEVRTVNDPDVRPYVHAKDIEVVRLPMQTDLRAIEGMLFDLARPRLGTLVAKGMLAGANDPSRMTKGRLLMERQRMMNNSSILEYSGGGDARPSRGLGIALYGELITLYHAVELLQTQGLGNLHTYLTSLTVGKGASKSKTRLMSLPLFQHMMRTVENAALSDGATESRKYAVLVEMLTEHFSRVGNSSETRVMVFAQYRETVHRILAHLRAHTALADVVRPMCFVGQAGATSPNTVAMSRGLTQKEQTQIVSQFRSGAYNTLVSTCIGEEGLDVGEVDLIVCFDAQASPTRMVQRMGRTGRKRNGRCVILVTEGLEEQQWERMRRSAEYINRSLLRPDQFVFCNSRCRMLPLGARPVRADQRVHMPEYMDVPARDGGAAGAGARRVNGPRTPARSRAAGELDPLSELADSDAAAALNQVRATRSDVRLAACRAIVARMDVDVYASQTYPRLSRLVPHSSRLLRFTRCTKLLADSVRGLRVKRYAELSGLFNDEADLDDELFEVRGALVSVRRVQALHDESAPAVTTAADLQVDELFELDNYLDHDGGSVDTARADAQQPAPGDEQWWPTPEPFEVPSPPNSNVPRTSASDDDALEALAVCEGNGGIAMISDTSLISASQSPPRVVARKRLRRTGDALKSSLAQVTTVLSEAKPPARKAPERAKRVRTASQRAAARLFFDSEAGLGLGSDDDDDDDGARVVDVDDDDDDNDDADEPNESFVVSNDHVSFDTSSSPSGSVVESTSRSSSPAGNDLALYRRSLVSHSQGSPLRTHQAAIRRRLHGREDVDESVMEDDDIFVDDEDDPEDHD